MSKWWDQPPTSLDDERTKKAAMVFELDPTAKVGIEQFVAAVATSTLSPSLWGATSIEDAQKFFHEIEAHTMGGASGSIDKRTFERFVIVCALNAIVKKFSIYGGGKKGGRDKMAEQSKQVNREEFRLFMQERGVPRRKILHMWRLICEEQIKLDDEWNGQINLAQWRQWAVDLLASDDEQVVSPLDEVLDLEMEADERFDAMTPEDAKILSPPCNERARGVADLQAYLSAEAGMGSHQPYNPMKSHQFPGGQQMLKPAQ